MLIQAKHGWACAVAVVASVVFSAPSYAGLFGFVDEIFTYRRDQKPLVRPQNYDKIPPKYYIEGNFDESLQSRSSQHYTQQNLVATEYMNGSASLVMRQGRDFQMRPNMGYNGEHQVMPAQPQGAAVGNMYGTPGGNSANQAAMGASENGTMHIGRPMGANSQNGQGPAHHAAHGTAPALGQAPISQQPNMGGSNPNFHLGAPGTGPALRGNQSQAGSALKIGEPAFKVGDEPNRRVTARPGDFDYSRPAVTYEPLNGGQPLGRGQNMGENPVQARSYSWNGAWANGPSQRGGHETQNYNPNVGRLPAVSSPNARYTDYNSAGQVTGYQVQTGDTLSGISAQDAIYDNWRLWPLIQDANRGKVKNPDVIYPNIQLGIPRGYSAQDARDATRRAIQHHSR